MSNICRIIIHWTGGVLTPNLMEKDHYHYLVGFKNGKPYVERGRYRVEDNLNCASGRYAQHCGGGNTGAVGIAVCGMLKATRADSGAYPFNEQQYDKMCRLVAEVARKYKIPIDSEHVMTHYEFGRKHPKTSSAGKPDISWLPFDKTKPSNKIGDDIRQRAQNWYAFLY